MRILRFFKDAGKLGVGSEIAAVIFYGIAWWEHAQNKTVSAYIFISFSVVLVWLGGFLAWSKTHDRLLALEKILLETPKIKLASQGFFHVEKTLKILGDLEPISCLCVQFINDPQSSAETCIAKNVLAHIDFFEVSMGTKFLFRIEGRWTESIQPGQSPEYQAVKSLNATEFLIGQTQQLDIAFKNGRHKECYAVSNHSWFHERLEDRNQMLNGTQFMVKVIITGTPHIKETFTFSFRNPGAGYYLEPIA